MRTLFFVNFVTLKMRDNPSNQVPSVSWLLTKPLELAVLKKAYVTFLSNAALFLTVFFACCVHKRKLNYIKNDFL